MNHKDRRSLEAVCYGFCLPYAGEGARATRKADTGDRCHCGRFSQASKAVAEKVTCHDDRFGGDAMLVVLMLFCAAGAVFLIGLGAYAEFRELWSIPITELVRAARIGEGQG